MCVTLPHLQSLDGTRVEHSERIQARQRLSAVQDDIVRQQTRYLGEPSAGGDGAAGETRAAFERQCAADTVFSYLKIRFFGRIPIEFCVIDIIRS